jgi:hypothetical protein
MSLMSELEQFTGTQHYYKIHPSTVLTDGAKYLADKGECYWWFDIIWSYQGKLKKQPFQVWKLKLNDKGGCTITCEDGDENILIKQEVPYTDFKFSYEVWASHDGSKLVIMLKGEY